MRGAACHSLRDHPLVVLIEVRSPYISRPHETARLPLVPATLVGPDRAAGYHSKVSIPADRSLPVLPPHGGIPDRISTRLWILGGVSGVAVAAVLGDWAGGVCVVTCRLASGRRGDLWLHSAHRPVTMPIAPTHDGGEDDYIRLDWGKVEPWTTARRTNGLDRWHHEKESNRAESAPPRPPRSEGYWPCRTWGVHHGNAEGLHRVTRNKRKVFV